MTVHRRVLFLGVTLLAIAASQGIELFVNRVLGPNAEDIAWISEAVLAVGFVLVTWLCIRLWETQIALTDLERQQIVADTQLTVAARVQTSLLPALPTPTAGIRWYAAVEPAGKVGGDYYDFLALPGGRMCVVLGDVSGKGVAAAVFLANVRATLRALARETTHARTLLSCLSSTLLADSTSGLYVTCIVAIVDPAARSMIYVNAGHPAGLLWSANGVRELRAGGPPAGLLEGAQYEEESVTFGEGDLVIFVSDGISEALAGSGHGVVDAIAAQIAQVDRPTPERVCAELLLAARRGSGPDGVDGWMDDRTAVAFGIV
jgi:serine phosphatase RsbU (regulator of sigma subunit)